MNGRCPIFIRMMRTRKSHEEEGELDIHHHFLGRKGIYNLDLGEDVPQIPFSVGLHPKDIDENAELYLDRVRDVSKNPLCWAVGECGLDSLVSVPISEQERVFEAQILLANEIHKPVIIHCVRRFSELLRFSKIAKTPLIVHGFNKKKSIADDLLKRGFYLSLGKVLLYSESLQGLVKDLPLDRVFLETDVWEEEVSLLYEQFARLKNISIEVLQEQIKKNIKKVFNKEI